MVYKSSSLASGSSSGTGGGTVSDITSTGGTITVTNPAGPTTNIDANLATSGSAGIVQPDNSTITISGGVISATIGGGGSVTNVSGVTANGFAFSISNPTTTPAITAKTTVTGLLQGNGTAISAVANGGISNALLANSAITVDAGTGLTGGGSVALGSSITLALTNSSVTVSGVSGVTGGGTVALGSSITLGMADSIANTLAGYNSSGVFSDVAIGSNLSLSGGTLISTTSPAPVTSVFSRIGAVTANYGDYNFNQVAGTAAVSQGGTGQTFLTTHAVLLGEGAVTGVGVATTGVASRLLIDQGVADPAFYAITGDSSMTSTGVMVNTAVHGVSYPANPSTNTVPIVTGSNTVTYEAVPNAALANSAITVNAQTGLAGGGSVALGAAITLSMGTGIANTLAGYNSSGVFSDVSIGSNLTLVAGVLNASASGGGISSVIGYNGISVVTTSSVASVGLAIEPGLSVIGTSSAASGVPVAITATQQGQSLVYGTGGLQFSYSAGTYYIDVRDYGAKGDCRRITDLTCTAGSSTITSLSVAQFQAADVGKAINVYDFTNSNYIMRSTIAAVSSISTAITASSAFSNLTSANGVTYLGTDNAAFINSALASAGTYTSIQSINANQPLGNGRIQVLFPTSSTGSGYMFSSQQLVVPTNVIINADAFLIAAVGAASTNTSGQANRVFSMIFKPGACIQRLEMDCCYTMGVQIGHYQGQSHSDIYNLTLWSVGGTNQSGNIATSAQLNTGGSGWGVGNTATISGGTGTAAIITVDAVSSGVITDWHISTVGNYSGEPTNPVTATGAGSGATFNLIFSANSQIGLDVSGNDYFIDYYWVKGANIGLHLDQNNDTLINQLFLIGCSTGCMMTSCEENFIVNAQIDTGSFAGFTIDGCHNCQVNAHAFAINSTALTYGLGIGQNDATDINHNLLINWTSDHHGGDAVRLANTTNSILNFNTTNATIYAGGGTAINNAIVYGTSVGSVVVTQNRDPGITIFTGTVGGVLNDNAGGVYTRYAGYTDGQILVGNTVTGAMAPSTLSAGANITITNSHGVVGITSTASGGGGAVSSVFGRTGAVVANWNDYQFNLIGGTATASQGGTGLATLTAHAVMLGEGVSNVSFATTGTAARILIDQGGVDPNFQPVSGDVSMISTGAHTVLAVHGVTYPASPSTNTIPAILSSNVATYTTALPNGITATTQAASDNSALVATDQYVNTAVTNALAAINPAVAVQAATIQASDTSSLTYNNGVSGIGATFTGANNVTLTIDGFTFNTLGQRLLVKNDTQSPSGAFNGVYYVTILPATLQGTVLTRALDYDQPSDINNTGAIPVINGTVNASTSWVETAQIVTVGVTPLVFAQFSYNPTTIITTSTTAGGVLAGTYPNPTFASSAFSAGADISLTISGSVIGISATGSAGAINSVSNSDGSLTISPTTGNVVASLNIGHANSWTATQTSGVSGGVSSYISAGCIEFSIFSNGNSGAGTPTIAWNNGNIQSVTITGACTLGFTNPTHPGRLTVISKMSATSGYNYTYAGTVLWPGGTIPTLSSISNAIDITSFLFDGSSIYGVANTGFAI